jgi:predicted metal-binding transcription factor (methanogenesis marker protein 9)
MGKYASKRTSFGVIAFCIAVMAAIVAQGMKVDREETEEREKIEAELKAKEEAAKKAMEEAEGLRKAVEIVKNEGE